MEPICRGRLINIRIKQGLAPATLSSTPAGSLKRDHAHPEHRPFANIDVVFVREGELAVITHTKHCQPGGYGLHVVAVPPLHRQIVFRDEQPPARVDVESARVNFLGLDMLDRFRFAGRLIDCKHHDAVFAAFEDWLAVILARCLSAIRGERVRKPSPFPRPFLCPTTTPACGSLLAATVRSGEPNPRPISCL